jgi:hypothetical protein
MSDASLDEARHPPGQRRVSDEHPRFVAWIITASAAGINNSPDSIFRVEKPKKSNA